MKISFKTCYIDLTNEIHLIKIDLAIIFRFERISLIDELRVIYMLCEMCGFLH